jgi:hypothetical protein
LNKEGQEKAFEYIDDLIASKKYIERGLFTEFGQEA